MSRFEEIVGEAIDEVVLGEAFKAEVLAAHVAERVRERQGGRRAEVSVDGALPGDGADAGDRQERPRRSTSSSAPRSPPSAGTRTLTGVQAQGMTACPCAQEMVAGLARERLADAGLRRRGDRAGRSRRCRSPPTTSAASAPSTSAAPRAARPGSTRRELLRIVESSMSSEIYELMKRPDEMAVVVKAHENPRFVEDCVREMVRQVVEGYPDLPDEAFVMARQENLETIHRHNVVAERYGTLGDLREELASGEHQSHHVTMREWLEAAGATADARPSASPPHPTSKGWPRLRCRVRRSGPSARSRALPRCGGAGRRSSRRR